MLRKSSLLVFFACIVSHLQAQFHLPPFDVEIKSGASAFDQFYTTNNDREYYDYVGIPFVQGGVNFHLSQYFALGVFGARSVGGKVVYESNEKIVGEYDAAYQIYGINARFAASRRVGVRPFLTVSYLVYQMYIDYGLYRVANDTKGYGISAGTMIRLSHRLYAILPEIGMKMRSQGFFFEPGVAIHLEAKGGLLYNFSKRK